VRRSRPTIPATSYADPPDGSISAGGVFDGIVHRGMSPDTLLGADAEVWEVVALPRSATRMPDLEAGSLVVQRALGEQRLGSMRVLGQDIDTRELYGDDGLIRPDILVLTPRRRRTRTDDRVDTAVNDDPAEWKFGALFRPWGRLTSVPARPGSAIGGRAFMDTIKGESDPRDWGARENAIVAQLVSGNMPDSLLTWITIDLAYKDSTRDLKGSVQVLPDYLAVGSDSDYVHVPLDPVSAQLVADRLNAVLPTGRICHAIYKQTAEKNRINAIERDYWQPNNSLRRTAKSGRTQASTAAYLEHSEAIQAKMKAAGIALGELVAGHKKDVVIARRLIADANKVAFHGFYDSKGYPHEPCYENADRKPKPSCDKDSPTIAHHRRFSDYSQGVRLVNPWIIVNGERKRVADVLADKDLSPLISNEGPIVPPRIPNTIRPASGSSESAFDTLTDVDTPNEAEPSEV
jgi:hypothetical protein